MVVSMVVNMVICFQFFSTKQVASKPSKYVSGPQPFEPVLQCLKTKEQIRFSTPGLALVVLQVLSVLSCLNMPYQTYLTKVNKST